MNSQRGRYNSGKRYAFRSNRGVTARNNRERLGRNSRSHNIRERLQARYIEKQQEQLAQLALIIIQNANIIYNDGDIGNNTEYDIDNIFNQLQTFVKESAIPKFRKVRDTILFAYRRTHFALWVLFNVLIILLKKEIEKQEIFQEYELSLFPKKGKRGIITQVGAISESMGKVVNYLGDKDKAEVLTCFAGHCKQANKWAAALTSNIRSMRETNGREDLVNTEPPSSSTTEITEVVVPNDITEITEPLPSSGDTLRGGFSSRKRYKKTRKSKYRY
jgi:hypothetical protein